MSTLQQRRFEQHLASIAGAMTFRSAKSTIRLSRAPVVLMPQEDRDALAIADTDLLEIDPSTIAKLQHISLEAKNRAAAAEKKARESDLAILDTIGEGGMGRVQLAHQRSLGREVAVKTLKEDATPDAATSLLAEARLTGSLEHPGVIPVHALGVDDHNNPLLVMKRVEGADWGKMLADPEHHLWGTFAGKTDRIAVSLEILTQLCRTLEFAHSRGIIHRDVKPQNVMVGSYGEVYLVDWGIATAKTSDHEGVIVGTPAHMAPEMLLARRVDERTDVYLLGATLHQVLTGHVRHDHDDIMDVCSSVLLSDPFEYGASVPVQLAELANQATSCEPTDRPQTVRAFREAIEAYLAHRSAHALSSSASERLVHLAELLAAATGDVPDDLTRAYRLATEARFGFTESLRTHPGNPVATDGLRSAVLALVDIELRQGHANTAVAMLKEIDDAPASFAERVARIRERDARQRNEDHRLALLDRANDASLGALPRLAIVGGLGVGLFGLTTLGVLNGPDEYSPLHLFVTSLAFSIGLAVTLAMFHDRVLTNSFNKRLFAIILGASTLVTVQRFVALLADARGSDSLVVTMWILVGTVGAAAFSVEKRFGWALPPLMAGALFTRLNPLHALSISSVSVMIAVLTIAYALRPRKR